ncbi:MAG: hypothetical protein ACOYOB_20065, partial [Myxococcota bacterium]
MTTHPRVLLSIICMSAAFATAACESIDPQFSFPDPSSPVLPMPESAAASPASVEPGELPAPLPDLSWTASPGLAVGDAPGAIALPTAGVAPPSVIRRCAARPAGARGVASARRHSDSDRAQLLAAFGDCQPDIDGALDRDEGWNEVAGVVGRFGAGLLSIKARHDGKDLFMLLQWQDPDSCRDTPRLALYFEDDGDQPDRVLDGEHEDCKYLGHSGLDGGFRDAHWDQGWSVAAEYGSAESGTMQGSWQEGVWTVEVRVPLATGESGDIDAGGSKTLGFALVVWHDGLARSDRAWPDGASPY